MPMQTRSLPGLKSIINELRQLVQNALLPSGAIVWFNLPNPPSGWVVCNGTNGTPNLIGRYPLGATSNIGTNVAAGLPEIAGVIGVNNKNNSGAFYHIKSGGGYAVVNATNHSAGFKASLYNPIYGNSTTVTPPSVKLLPCMKL